jgi:hypothetical protein
MDGSVPPSRPARKGAYGHARAPPVYGGPMRETRRVRELVVDGSARYTWWVRHRHGRGEGEVCREVLTLHRDGVRTLVVFREGEDRAISRGRSYTGCVATGPGRLLNLREPGVVRAIVDEATARGLLPDAGTDTDTVSAEVEVEVDGWELFDTVLSRAAAATPAAPPGSPPGP